MKWRPVDYFIGILIAAIVYIVIMMGLAPLLDTHEHGGAKGLETRAAFLSSIISIITLYVGAKMRGNDDE